MPELRTLLEREMQEIRPAGYTIDEKVHIAKQYLLPKQFKSNGIKDGELSITDSALRDIARYYTREAGVRGFDRDLAYAGSAAGRWRQRADGQCGRRG